MCLGSRVTLPALLPDQQTTLDKMRNCAGFLDMSEPGTGKSRVSLEDWVARRQQGGGRMLVTAPKSILEFSWGNEIKKWLPGITYTVAYAHNREKAFKANSDIVLTNHDAVTTLVQHPAWLAQFDTLDVDEFTAFKNPDAQRTRALFKLRKLFKWLREQSGTPTPNSILEIWAPVFVADQGERLGSSYYKFRNATCEAVQVGPDPHHVEWREKDGSALAVFDLIKDISDRRLLTGMPDKFVTEIFIDLPPRLRAHYDAMDDAGILVHDDVKITSVHAAAQATKLLQIASGVVYGADGQTLVLDDGRAELIMDLIDQRSHCIVAFGWKHQRDRLIEAAIKRGFSYGVIDGDTDDAEKFRIASKFQAGDLRVIFAHPRSAGHGLTLTKGTTTIWASPQYTPELWEQFNRRIFRLGQTERTETIKLVARKTREEEAYKVMEGKHSRMDFFRGLFASAA
jgi:SNF2 family DNA or RNA helicase